jgi:hypothetical protein
MSDQVGKPANMPMQGPRGTAAQRLLLCARDAGRSRARSATRFTCECETHLPGNPRPYWVPGPSLRLDAVHFRSAAPLMWLRSAQRRPRPPARTSKYLREMAAASEMASLT